MARANPLTTRVLLVCAAIGVGTGIIGGIAGLITPAVLVVAPIVYGLVLGSHVIPGIIAQEVLRLPLVAIVTHVIAALVASAFAVAFAPRFLGTALLFGGIQELVVALTRYRAWGAWRFFVSAAIIGVLVAVTVGFAADVWSMAIWAQVTYFALAVAGPIVWTGVALSIGAALRRAGVAPRR